MKQSGHCLLCDRETETDSFYLKLDLGFFLTSVLLALLTLCSLMPKSVNNETFCKPKLVTI